MKEHKDKLRRSVVIQFFDVECLQFCTRFLSNFAGKKYLLYTSLNLKGIHFLLPKYKRYFCEFVQYLSSLLASLIPLKQQQPADLALLLTFSMSYSDSCLVVDYSVKVARGC